MLKGFRKYCVSAAVIAVLLSSSSYVQAQQGDVTSTQAAISFLQYIDDVPLMEGLYESTEESMVFEKPEGRIVKTTALSQSLNVQSIEKFYAIALPQLGWHEVSENTYLRQDEKITIRYARDSDYTLVYFTLEPSKT